MTFSVLTFNDFSKINHKLCFSWNFTYQKWQNSLHYKPSKKIDPLTPEPWNSRSKPEINYKKDVFFLDLHVPLSDGEKLEYVKCNGLWALCRRIISQKNRNVKRYSLKIWKLIYSHWPTQIPSPSLVDQKYYHKRKLCQ